MRNRLKITYNSTPIPNHTIKWKFRFWKYETMDNASLNKYGVHFDELSSDQQEEIFNTTKPDFEGTDSPIYGSITQTSKTDSSGIAKSTYTAGTEPGFIEIEAQDKSMKIASRGSFGLIGPIMIRNEIEEASSKIPDIDIDIGLSEEAEEEIGAYIELNHTRSFKIKVKGILPENAKVRLECDNPSKISVWDGSNKLNLPHTFSVSSLPQMLTIKGEKTSDTIKDITLTLKLIIPDVGCSFDKVKVTVFKIDLDWDGLDDEIEDETCLYIPLNIDDDNSDTILDKDQYPVDNENDLKKLIIRTPSPSNLPNFISLTISSGNDKIKLWEHTKKITQVTSRKYNISDELQSETWLWAEGYNETSEKEMVEIKITYNAPDGTVAEDKVKAKVDIKKKILLDPGHGGRDSGAVGPTGLKEKDVNLDIALRLRDLLKNVGLEVEMTRDTDIYLEPKERADEAKNWKPVFFLSIHQNAEDLEKEKKKKKKPTARGTETWVPRDAYLVEEEFAHKLQQKVHSVVLEEDRGVKKKTFTVLNHKLNGDTFANLIEITFISHPESEERLRQESFRQAVAEAMKKAILEGLVENYPYPKIRSNSGR